MQKTPSSIIILRARHMDKNPGIILESSEPDIVHKFRTICRNSLDKSLKCFHQGDTDTWQFFESWGGNPILLKNEAIRIADELGVEIKAEY